MNADKELGRRLAGAYVSYTMGIKSVDRTIKEYCDDVGDFWVELGKDIMITMADVVAKQVEKATKP